MRDSKENTRGKDTLNVGVLTISDTRARLICEGKDEDVSGKIIQKKLEEGGYASERVILADEITEIKDKLDTFLERQDIDLIITTGGTGLGDRDKTIEVIRSYLDKEITGFGELLRRLGYEEVGLRGVFNQATAGLSGHKPIFCLPGTPNAVDIAMDVIVKDLDWVVEQALK